MDIIQEIKKRQEKIDANNELADKYNAIAASPIITSSEPK